MIEYIIAPCRTKATFSAKPVKQARLNLKSIGKEFDVEIETPTALFIAEHGGIIVHNYGEIFFKTLTDEALIKKLADRIYKAGA